MTPDDELIALPCCRTVMVNPVGHDRLHCGCRNQRDVSVTSQSSRLEGKKNQ
jgi:hypothetical protein